VVVGATGLLADLPRRDDANPILRWLTWTAIRVVVIGVAGLTAAAVLRTSSTGFLVLFGAVTAAFVAESTLDLALTVVAPTLRGKASWLTSARAVAPAVLGSVPLQAPLVATLAYSYLHISPWSVALFAIPAVAAQRLHLLYRQQRETAQALAHANARLGRANLSFATALVATLDARDRYTAGHSAAVAIYARDIASRLGLSEQEQELAHLCGLVHDVGKIGLPAGLLEKPGALSLDERRQMEAHSVIGERILKNVDDYTEIAEIVRYHHERVDGNGYPDKLTGEEIPLLARIIAVADAYNAMTSDRPYRDAMPSRVARLRLAQAVETQFDTSVVAAFEAILAGATEGYRMASDPEFVLTHAAFKPAAERAAEPTREPLAIDEALHRVAAQAALTA
jgi:putative nucleotidyltransferase with HDIG domain